MKLSKKTKMLARVLSFGMMLQSALIPFAGGMRVALAAEIDSVASEAVASFPLERSYCLQTEKLHACTKYYDYYDTKGDLVSSGLEEAKAKLAEQFAKAENEVSTTQSTDRRVLTETRSTVAENNTPTEEKKTDTTPTEEKKTDTTPTEEKKTDETQNTDTTKKEDEKDTGAQVNETTGADEDKGVNSDPERKLACPRGYVLDKIYDACCPTTDGETPVGKYDPYTGKCGTAEKEETKTVFTCPRGYVVDEKYDMCCPTDDEGKAVGKYSPTTGKCGEADAKSGEQEQKCDPGYELDATYKKCCPNNDEVKSKYDPFTDSCKQVSEEPVEKMTCDRGYVLDEHYDACCPTDENGKALGKYDPNQKMCVPDKTEEEPTDPQPAVTCPRGYILDEKYDACCPTNENGEAVGAYNPETDKCGDVKADDVVNTVTCGDGNYLVESVGKCCPVNSTYDASSGNCTNIENKEEEGGSNNSGLLTTALGALGGMFGGKLFGKPGGGNQEDGIPSDKREAQGLPFAYKVGISDGNDTGKAVYETDANGNIPEAAIYDGQLTFKADLGKNADKVAKMEYSFMVKQGGKETQGYDREPLPNNKWVKVVDINELNAMLNQLARQGNSNNSTEYFVYVWVYPKNSGNQSGSSTPKPYQVKINIQSTMNSLSDGEDCKSNKDKCKFTVTSDAGAVLAQYSDFIGTITKDARFNAETNTCDVEMRDVSGILETVSRDDLKENNDVVFGGKQVVLQVNGLSKEACESGVLSAGKKMSANHTSIKDDSTGGKVYVNANFADDVLSVENGAGAFNVSRGSFEAAQHGNESTLFGAIQDGEDGTRIEDFAIMRGEDGRYVAKREDLTPAQLDVAYSNAESLGILSDPSELEEVEFKWQGNKLHAYVNGQELKGNEGTIQPDPNGIAGDTGWVTQQTSAGKVTQAVNGMQYVRTATGEIVNAGVTTAKGLFSAGRDITMFGAAGADDRTRDTNGEKDKKINGEKIR